MVRDAVKAEISKFSTVAASPQVIRCKAFMRKRALLSCSDKSGLKALGVCLSRHGVELVATGKTAEVLKAAGLAVTPVETLSGSPEAFQGRMEDLSFPLLSGVLFLRRQMRRTNKM